jgi:hypothetical protein
MLLLLLMLLMCDFFEKDTLGNAVATMRLVENPLTKQGLEASADRAVMVDLDIFMLSIFNIMREK